MPLTKMLMVYGCSAMCAFVAVFASAHAGTVVAGLDWDADGETVAAVLANACDATTEKTIDPPQFPLANAREQHLLCDGLTLADKKVAKAAFVVADDKLKLIELRGGAVEAVTGDRSDEPSQYIDFDVYGPGEIFADRENDIVWLLSDEARHPNLFMWENPLLDHPQAEMPRYNASAVLPAFLSFGGDIETLRPQMEAACPLLLVEESERVWLPSKPQKQTQINCFGYEYAGFPRKIEAVFGDGKLALAWILTGAAEEERVRRSLIAVFGAPEKVFQDWEVFNGGEVVLRKDKPEVLAIAPELVPFFEARISGE
ncbi:MAG: hypothetical protein AAGA09_04090 [Pseudomonadota bacterium]